MFCSKSSHELTEIPKSGLNSSFIAKNSRIQKISPHLIINKINDEKNIVENFNAKNNEE
jgi:hypothetical protein